MRRIAALLLPAYAAALAAMGQGRVSLQVQDGPIRKIVNLLTDMKGQMEADRKADEDVNEKMTCWCTKNKEEKAKAIELGKEKVEELTIAVTQETTKLAQLKVTLNQTEKELAKHKEKLAEAAAFRKKEHDEFVVVEEQLDKAQRATLEAVRVLKEANPSADDIKKAASALQTSRVVSLALAGATDAGSARALQGFVADVASSSSSFLQQRRGSGDIRVVITVLEVMQGDMERDLERARSDEADSRKRFEELEAAKKEEIGAGESAIKRLDKEIAASQYKLAQDKQDLRDTRDTLENDKDFLQMVQGKCERHEKEYEKRTKDRMTELAGVQDAIQILDSDESFEVFGKTVAFLQVSSKRSASDDKQARCKQAAAVLQKMSQKASNPQLLLLALSLQGSGQFDKVLDGIKRMEERLVQDQKLEAEKYTWCQEEQHQNKHESQKAYHEQANLLDEAERHKKDIDIAWREVNTTLDQIEKMTYQMQKASETREEEHEAFQQTVTDQRVARKVLQKALLGLREVYGIKTAAFLESGAGKVLQQGSHHGGQPQGLSDYRKNFGGKAALDMIELVIEKSDAAEKDAIDTENEAREDYQTLTQKSNTVIAEMKFALVGQQSTLAERRESLSRNGVNFQQNMDQLEALSTETQKLDRECGSLTADFNRRQARLQPVDWCCRG